jgi:hypothetical protein
MDNSDLVNFDEDDGFPAPVSDKEAPIPFDDSDPTPKTVSRKPLNLGGNSQATPRPVAPKPVAKPVAKPVRNPVSNAVPPSVSPVASAVPGDRITGMKTFFTKLHGGALNYLDESVSEWLKANPTILIKRTNVTVGEVASKKTEPNLILSIWY